jgi:FkbM family methyltransferase
MKKMKGFAKNVVNSPLFILFAKHRLSIYFIRFLPNRYQIFILSGMKQARIFSLSVQGLDFTFQSSFTDDHFQSIFLNSFDNWEANSIATWLNAIADGDTVVDVGSYLGVYSILAAKAGAKRVIAYEPNPFTYEGLRANVALNDLGGTIVTRMLALSDFVGSAELFHPPGREMSSGSQLRNNNQGEETNGWDNKSEVCVTTLDEEVKALNLGRVGAIKIDAEGYEMQVLKGAAQTLGTSRPVMIIELHSFKHLKNASGFLLPLGYSQPLSLDEITQNANQVVNADLDIARNYLFIPFKNIP